MPQAHLPLFTFVNEILFLFSTFDLLFDLLNSLFDPPTKKSLAFVRGDKSDDCRDVATLDGGVGPNSFNGV